MPETVAIARTGNVAVEIKRLGERYRFVFRDPERGNRYHTGTYADLEKAKAKAKAVTKRLDRYARGKIEVDRKEWEKLQEEAAPPCQVALGDAAVKFITAKSGSSSPRTARVLANDVRLVVEGLGYDTPIDSIPAEEIEAWVHSIKAGARRKANMRAVCVQLWRWCRRRRILPDVETEAEKTERIKPGRPVIGVFSPDEMATLLRVVGDDFLNAVLLGGFAGLRPEEIIPNTGSEKPVVTWDDVLWERSSLRVPADVAKTRKTRLVPIKPNLMEWLLPQRGSSGRICEATSPISKNETGRLRVEHNIRWKHDVLRHSYGTYRVAECRDYWRVSNEMGNSVAVCRGDYDAVSHEEIAEAWFAITPQTVGNQKQSCQNVVISAQ